MIQRFFVLIIISINMICLIGCKPGISDKQKAEYLSVVINSLNCNTEDLANIQSTVYFLNKDIANKDSNLAKDQKILKEQYQIAMENLKMTREEVNNMQDFDKEFPLKQEAGLMLDGIETLYQTKLKPVLDQMEKGETNETLLADISAGWNDLINQAREMKTSSDLLQKKHSIKNEDIRELHSCKKRNL